MTTLKERVSSNQEVNQSTQRILVVDDENSISELIATSLKFVGFDVRTAASGSQALQIAQEFKPHALILDVMLPDLQWLLAEYDKYLQLRVLNFE
jgi:two-component system OmpR family response regulator